ncbi:unnamed protein product, partial [Rotaria magnacalcarata]
FNIYHFHMGNKETSTLGRPLEINLSFDNNEIFQPDHILNGF